MKLKRNGSRAEVWHGNALMTTGGLKKKDLMKNKHGRIVSAKKHMTAKKEKRLVKAGYKTEKGKFGAKKTMKKGGVGASIDVGVAAAKVGRNSGVRVGTKKHNIQANLGLDGVNVNALNLASASLDRKGLNASIGDDRIFKADGSLTKAGLKASVGNKKIFNADGSLTKAGLKASVGNKKIFNADGSLTKAGLKASVGNKRILKGDASLGLSGVEVGADHLMGRTGVKLGKTKKTKKTKKKGGKKRSASLGPLEVRVTGGKSKKR